MKLVVTDLLPKKQIIDSIYIVTTKEDVLKAYREIGVDGIRADESTGILSEEISTILDHINKCMIEETDIYMDHKLQMLWEITDCPGENISTRIGTVFSIIKKCILLLDKKFDFAEIYYGKSNKDVCNVIEKILKFKGVSYHIHFGEIGGRFSFFINQSNSCLKPLLLNVISIISIAKLMYYCLFSHKNKKKKAYTFGAAMCSDAVRIYNWVLDTIDEIKKFDSYKILCMECRTTYSKFLKLGIEADLMEEWTNWNITQNKLTEYFKLRRKVKKNINRKYKFQYFEVDFSEVIRNILDIYIYSDMLKKYRWNIVCASYFKYNSYKLIEPWCTSSYPETRVFYINTEKSTKYCRCYPCILYFYKGLERWPEIFDVIFFSTIGMDLKKEFERYKWKGKSYFSDLKEEKLYERWYEKKNIFEIECKNEGNKLTIFYAPSGPTNNICTIGDVVGKSYMILDYAKLQDINFICKFHPNNKDCDQIKDLMKKYQVYNNITFANVTEDAQRYIQKSDIIITDVSTIILDGIVARKPVICFLSPREYEIINYLSSNVLMFLDISDLAFCLEEIQENNYFNSWKKQRLACQDEVFRDKSVGVNRWSKLREMALETL